MANERQDRLSFLEIPTEIRNHIYRDVLVERTSIKLRDGPPFIQEPNLLVTCKQVRTEAVAIFYGANCWESVGANALKLFMQKFRHEKLLMLRSLYIIAPADILEVSGRLSKPGRAVQYLLHGNGRSWSLYTNELMLEGARQLGEELVRGGERNGIQRRAMLLSVFTLDCTRAQDLAFCPARRLQTI